VTAKGSTFASIDVGTTKICTLVAEVTPEGEMRILGIGVAPAAGISRGMVDNIRDASESIRASVEKAERSSATRVLSAHVGIAGSHIQSLNNRGIVAIPERQRPITADDVARVLDGARVVSLPANREILHVIPRFYVVDGQDSVSDPLGMFGQRLDVETHIITGTVSAIQNLSRCVEGIGVQVDSLILQPLASAEAVLEEEEKRQGVVLADIGGGTTDIALFLDGAVYHTAVLGLGGHHMTRDLVIGLRCPYKAAEEAKATFGHAIPSSVDPEEMLEIDAFGSERHRTVQRRQLCEILQARAEEILEMVVMEVKRSVQGDIVSAGLVLTGGSAKLEGIDVLAEQVTGLPARVGRPRNLQGLSDTLADPAYAASVGLLQWAVRESEQGYRNTKMRPPMPFGGWMKRFTNWARVLLPE
jgi:cell division protein FtsA